MGNVKNKILSGFQWKRKWVRVMLIASTVIMLALIFTPKFDLQERPMMVTESLQYDLPETYVDSLEQKTTPRSQPKRIVRQVEQKEPFDWKGTITWAIGAMNGFILIVLNIKNLVLKKK